MVRRLVNDARLRRVTLAFALLPAVVRVANAQRVAGTVADEASGRAIEEFTVRLLDAQGRTIAATLSKPGGHFSLAAPTPGAYTLVVLRIGFRRTQSDVLTLRAGEVVQQTLRMAQVPARLKAVRVDDTPQCEGSRHDGTGFVAVWDEIEKTVQAVELTQDAAPLEMTIRNYHRDVSLRSGATTSEASEVRSGRTRAPYVSPDPEELARTGYVQRAVEGTTYIAPDARTLLSRSFVASHCFTLVSDAEHGSALIGVSFVPVASRSVADIRGTLWVDRQSGELRTLDFTYTGLPAATRGSPYGGRVGFQHIPGGAWVIGTWRVRAPYLDVVPRAGMVERNLGLAGARRAPSVSDTVVQRVRDEGGEVLAVRDADGRVLWVGRYSTIRGVVRDSATHAAIAAATVSLRGTTRRVVASTAGTFLLDSVPPGDYTLVAESPTPQGTPVLRATSARVGVEQPFEVTLELPYTATSSRDSLDAIARMSHRCDEARTARERWLSEVFAQATNRAAPTGADSAAQADAFRRSSVVLQAIADTTGRVDLSTARALKRGSQAAYVEALNALSQLQPSVDEPVPGCKLRGLVLLPYMVHSDR